MNHDIAIIDYGVGNLHSVYNAVKQFTDSVIVTDDPEIIKSAKGLILPGVGAFRAGMEGLRVRQLTQTVLEFAASGKPLLGICLGAQMLLSKGYEFGEWEGLGLIPGEVVKFPDTIEERLPHIGWNSVYGFASDMPLLKQVPDGADVYFVHSYILVPRESADCAGRSKYGSIEFCSVVQKGNIYATQFHPEKSGSAGLTLFKNFIHLAQADHSYGNR
jgi:glutamine amidotransferase